MTATQLLLLALVVIAAVVAGYFIGRWSADRELGARSARPNPLPSPGDELPDSDAYDPVPSRRTSGDPVPTGRPRGAPPPASAGGGTAQSAPAPVPRQRSSAPPAASAGGGVDRTDAEPAASRPKRGPPPPAAAGLMGDGQPKRNR